MLPLLCFQRCLGLFTHAFSVPSALTWPLPTLVQDAQVASRAVGFLVCTDLWCYPMADEGGGSASNSDSPGGDGRAAAASSISNSNGNGILGLAGSGMLPPPLQGPGILEIKCPYNGGSPETARPPKRPQWWAASHVHKFVLRSGTQCITACPAAALLFAIRHGLQ